MILELTLEKQYSYNKLNSNHQGRFKIDSKINLKNNIYRITVIII